MTTTTASITTKIGTSTAKTTQLPKGASEVVVRDTEIKGYHLRIHAAGSKTYSFAGRIAGSGQRRTVQIGDAMTMPASEARAEAERLRNAFRAGRDPVLEREAEAQRKAAEAAARITLDTLAGTYLEKHAAGSLPSQKRPPTRRGAESEASDVRRALALQLGEPKGGKPAPTFGSLAVTEVTIAHGRAVQAAVGHLAPESRKRLFGAARRVVGYAVTAGHRQDNPLASLKAPAGSDRRTRCLNPTELKRVWDAAGSLGVEGQVVRFLAAQPVRVSIATGLTFGQVDLDKMTITVGSEMEGNKSDDLWILPLTDFAAEIIRARKPECRTADELVFAGVGRLTSHFKARLDKAAKVTAWQLHDLRRTAASLTGDAHDDLDEAAFDLWLMHRRGGVHGVYQTSKRLGALRRTANQWSATLAGIINPGSTNVVPLAAAS